MPDRGFAGFFVAVPRGFDLKHMVIYFRIGTKYYNFVISPKLAME
jgi:hypothetical protein